MRVTRILTGPFKSHIICAEKYQGGEEEEEKEEKPQKARAFKL
jgi:hypothetical protein